MANGYICTYYYAQYKSTHFDLSVINSSPSGKTYSTLMHIHFNIGHGLGQFNHSDVLAPQRLVTAELVRSYEHEQKKGIDFPSLCKFV